MSNDVSEGIWRDEECLVVKPSVAVFPDICVKTGLPAEGNRKAITVGKGVTKLSWEEMAAVSVTTGLASGLAGSAAGDAVMAAFGPKRLSGFVLEIPLAEEFLVQWKKRSVRGRWLMALGIGGFVFLCLAYIVAMTFGASDAATDWMLYCMAPLPIVGLVGAGYLYAYRQPILIGERLSDFLVRLHGVAPSVVDRFPEWDQKIIRSRFGRYDPRA